MLNTNMPDVNVSFPEKRPAASNLPSSKSADIDVAVFQIQDLLLSVVTCKSPAAAIPDADDGFAEATDAASVAATPIDACRRRDRRLGAAGVSATVTAERRRALGWSKSGRVASKLWRMQVAGRERRRRDLVVTVPLYQVVLIVWVHDPTGVHWKLATVSVLHRDVLVSTLTL